MYDQIHVWCNSCFGVKESKSSIITASNDKIVKIITIVHEGTDVDLY